MKIVSLILPLLLALVVAGCDLLGSDSSSAGLSVQPVSSVEAALTIRANSSSELSILRDGQVVAEFRLSGRDTVFIDNGLQPLGSYSWQVFIEGRPVGRKVSAAMPDTTSSNFTWQTFTFGGTAGSSVLHDVAIINENNIWVVGEIYVRDEAHINGYQMYNAVHWDGTAWELKQVPFEGFPSPGCGAVTYPPIRAIWHFSEKDIWFTSGGTILHYNGDVFLNDCRMNSLLTGATNKIWGTSSNNLYIVGNGGSIAHYDGTTWRKIESGTQLPFRDIHGTRHPETGKWQILAVASNLSSVPTGHRLIEINGTSTRELPADKLSSFLRSVYFVPGHRYFAVGAGVHVSPEVRSGTYWGVYPPGEVTNYVSRHVRGLGLNDVIVAGDFGEIVHFNGATWKKFQLMSALQHGYYLSIALTDYMAVAVGQSGQSAVIAVGRR